MDMYSMVQRKGLRTALSRIMNARSAQLEERLIIVVVVSVRDIEMVKDRMVLSFICSFFFSSSLSPVLLQQNSFCCTTAPNVTALPCSACSFLLQQTRAAGEEKQSRTPA